MQVIDFPTFGADGRAAIAAIVRICTETPVEGEPAREFKSRLRAARLWSAERPASAPQFFGVGGAKVVPSAFMRDVAEATDSDGQLDAILHRLWKLNPPMAAAIIEQINERPHGKDELTKFLGSSGYGGTPPLRPAVEAWLQLAVACGALRPIGIAVAGGPRLESLSQHAEGFDLADFLDGDTEELLEPLGATVSDDDSAAPVVAIGGVITSAVSMEPSIPVTASAPATISLPAALRHLAHVALPNPLGSDRPVPTSQFASSGAGTFDDDVIAETRRRLHDFWSRAAVQNGGFTPSEFGLDAEAWMENADELLYRIAVAAALVFRLEASRDGVIAAYRALDDAGVLADLFHGTVPETLPAQVDARALMLASLAARRCAETPELAAELERASTASERFATLDQALGRGLFRIELFWILGQLSQLGVIRGDDLGDVTATPYRVVRDTLFRLGLLATPYAVDADDLLAAARAARRLAGDANAEEFVTAFALAAGCRYQCPNRKVCDLPCRERLE